MMQDDRILLRIRKSQLAYLYAAGRYALPALLMIALFAAWTTAGFVSPALWQAWGLSMLAVLACRTLHLVWRQRRRSGIGVRQLEHEYVIGATCSAIVWCLGLLFFMHSLPDAERLLLVLLSCMYLAASGILLMNNVRCFYGTAVPICLVTELELLSEASGIRNILMAVVLFCLLFAMLVRRHVLRWQEADLYHRYAHADMARRLRRTSDALRLISQQDGLTGLANRACFDTQLELAWGRCSRAVSPLSLLLLDVDYFKQYNDTYGHQQGDICLQQLAQILRQVLQRESDLAARYGGEEFVLLLPFTSQAGAWQLAQRIRQALAEQAIPHQGSAIDPWVTCSIGLVTLVPDGKLAAGELVAFADEALYRAKNSGRNQVVVAGTQTGEVKYAVSPH